MFFFVVLLGVGERYFCSSYLFIFVRTRLRCLVHRRSSYLLCLGCSRGGRVVYEIVVECVIGIVFLYVFELVFVYNGDIVICSKIISYLLRGGNV